MPYIIEVVRAGNTVEVSKYYSSRFNKKGIRKGDKKNLTTEEQKKVNKRAAEKKLRRLINENFKEGDTHLVLDYKLSERPTGREGMRADADDFLKEMRKLYKSLGLVFKYIHVMEIGKKGALHHHLVINTPEEVSQRAITKAWKGRGRTHFNPLDDSGQYSKLIMAKVHKKRVLLVDNDIQANVSKFFNVHDYDYKSMENVLRDEETIAEDVIRSSGTYSLDIIPANMNLDAAAVDLMLDQEANQMTSITSLCYSCKRYSECNVKTGTCEKCDRYINKAEAEKTEEQRYSEEQDRIDRETKAKLKERADAEKMEHLPSETVTGKKVHSIRLAKTYFNDVASGKKSFELRKNDREYKVGDMLEMLEFADGKNTGRIIQAEVVYMLEEYTGLEEGYCILGISVLKVSDSDTEGA